MESKAQIRDPPRLNYDPHQPIATFPVLLFPAPRRLCARATIRRPLHEDAPEHLLDEDADDGKQSSDQGPATAELRPPPTDRHVSGSVVPRPS